MKNEIKLDSRYGTKNYLVKDTDKSYILNTESPFIRTGMDGDNYVFIDPSGGPMIGIGSIIENMIVDKITHEQGKGYIITFR